ncbi:TNF receptor-associated factor 3-like isoform X1 [Watersipora subatra]|uniref:TNF receptor-associated factor 3-like isoform X1 n=1 Tax=Watersipora subatra TaxID=2589382 RepID=UPI00355BFD70
MAAASETTNMDIEQHNSVSSSADEFSVRPVFVRTQYLIKHYVCRLCQDILVQPQQTICGRRICKACIDRKFGSENVIPCPMPHDDIDEDELAEEPCQETGLHRNQVVPDSASLRVLLREKCFCPHKVYGCSDTPMWKKLKDHVQICQFTPVHCTNAGCPKKFAKEALNRHLEQCLFMVVPCNYCGERFKRNQLEDHYGECENADTQCSICSLELGKRRQLVVHQRIHVPCITAAGKCYFYDYCKFEAATVPILKEHMEKDKDNHLECLAVQMHEMHQMTAKTKDLSTIGIKKVVNNKVKPLEKVVAEVAMAVKKLGDKLQVSETDGDHLVNAMRTVAHILQQIEQINRKGGMIERQIRDSGLDKVTVIESLSQSIRRINEQQNEMEKRLKGQKSASYEGVLIWRISDYKRKKSDAIRGLQMSIYSYPFYSSRYGYKICAKACLNGDELGRGKCLSLFFVLMRGEYDEHLTFPFKQRVTFTLICPSNSELDKHETFVPDQDSSSFRKPLTDMNIASGCPQFALHSEVESRHFLVSDSIYLRVKVEPSGDIIP